MSGGFGGAVNEFFTGADTAPTPQVNSSPPAQEAPKTWAAPDVSADQHITVHRDHLTSAADVIKAHLPELDAAVRDVEQQLNAFTSLAGWQAGEQIRQNLEALVQACAKLGQQTSDTHAQAAGALYETAAAYGSAEDANTQAANNVAAPSAGAPASDSSGSANGGWS